MSMKCAREARAGLVENDHSDAAGLNDRLADAVPTTISQDCEDSTDDTFHSECQSG